MARDELVALCGYLIVGFMAAPLVMAVVTIVLAAIRNRRLTARSSIDQAARDRSRPMPARKPLEIVERSAGGYVRVTPLPLRASSSNAGYNSPSSGKHRGQRIVEGERRR